MFTNFITPARVVKTRGRAFYHWPPGRPNLRSAADHTGNANTPAPHFTAPARLQTKQSATETDVIAKSQTFPIIRS